MFLRVRVSFCDFAEIPSDPHPCNFADFNRRGGGGPWGKSSQRSDPGPGPSLIMISWCLIFTASLLIMTPLAEGSPVAPVPEELLVTSVGNDVVHHRSLDVLTLFHTLLAQWVRLQELFAGLLPRTIVTPAGCGPYLLRVLCPVYLAVLGPGRHEVRAARMLARDLRFHRHQRTNPHSANFSKPPSSRM